MSTPTQVIEELLRKCVAAREKAHHETERMFWTAVAKVRDDGIISTGRIGEILGMTTEGMRHNFNKHGLGRSRWGWKK